MPFYYRLRRRKDGPRTATSLLTLREQMRQSLPRRTVNDTLLLATWNIRDFDSNKFGHGPRLNESLYYIAEVISAFDVVALQEVNDDLTALDKVMAILGYSYDFIATDTTEGTSGNRERMAFVYDRRKVSFRKIAGELVLPQSQLIGVSGLQFARTPFVVSFQSGWFKFDLCTVHIFYGAESGERLQRRIDEIESVARFLKRRAKSGDTNLILLGDFNIVSPEHKTMKALQDQGFTVPPPLQQPTNLNKDHFYDQIAFMVRPEQLRMGDSSPNAGVFDFYESVFTSNDLDTYREMLTAERVLAAGNDEGRYYLNTWRTFQMSDHLPLWVELKIDFSEDYLDGLRT